MKDNCLQICLAKYFNLDLEEVPHFIQYGDRWKDKMNDWLEEKFGLIFMSVDVHPVWQDILKNKIFIVSINSKIHYGLRHAVIVRGDYIIYDPNDGFLIEPIKLNNKDDASYFVMIKIFKDKLNREV